jgi:hypothetical protein
MRAYVNTHVHIVTISCAVLIWNIQMKQSGISHEIPHTIPEDYMIPVSFAHVPGVWFLQVAVSQTQNPSWQDTGDTSNDGISHITFSNTAVFS